MNCNRAKVAWTALLVAAVVAGCGGGGGGGDSGSDDGGGQTSNLPDVPSGYVKYWVPGPGRDSWDSTLFECNRVRQLFGAEPQGPWPEDVRALLDGHVSEAYYDAATGAGRYEEHDRFPSPTWEPLAGDDAPPDCSTYKIAYIDTTVIHLRDGRRAEVKYDDKTGNAVSVSIGRDTKTEPQYPNWDDNLPTQRIAGQTCIEIPSAGLATGVCQWSVYKEVLFKNLPIPLEQRFAGGTTVRATVATTDRAQFGAYATHDIDALPEGVPVK